ncbi:MAG TPA: DUF4189 domain-containing protein [Solirubrobacterales bacterium]|jgi:hypothetical protein|nr:DUF4189 domain-containing protein [Solirubrobacterales bacterium]
MRISPKLVAALAALALLLAAPAAAQASWGAIAIEPTAGKIGYSRHVANVADAKKKALEECGESHCKVAVWVFNGYGAVVKKKNDVYIAGIGASKHLAFEDARKRAHEQSAPAVAWVFSGLS